MYVRQGIQLKYKGTVMDVLKIDLENCFGIGKFQYTFNFKGKNTNTFLIYAPNGTMKTSFARTLHTYALNDSKNKPKDKIYTDRKSRYSIFFDEDVADPNLILVVDTEDKAYDPSSKITSFLASRDLKSKYDDIFNELNSAKEPFVTKLKNISRSTDCEKEILLTFNNSSFFEILLSIENDILNNKSEFTFKYNNIFDNKGNVKKFLDKNKNLLNDYFKRYTELIEKSSFFGNYNQANFGTYQAKELLESIKDDSFFLAGHKLKLKNGDEISASKDLSDLIEKEIISIIEDSSLKETFEKVDKAIGNNVELRNFKLEIEQNNSLLAFLSDYDKFKKSVWVSYLYQCLEDYKQIISIYKSKNAELQGIIAEANRESEIWKNIIKTFNSRFFVPFKIEIENQSDIILNLNSPKLKFLYSDDNGTYIEQDKDSLINSLSRGEQRAFFILQLLFDIESRKNNQGKTLIVFDDIAESFDYKNKYAIVEYIKDLNRSNNFRLLILTHNFDFYRTISSRINLGRNHIFMATKNQSTREIALNQGQYTKNILNHYLENINQLKIFIGFVPFLRNIIEYIETESNPDYLKLTSCLHIKNDTEIITFQDIYDIANRYMPNKLKDITFGNNKYYDELFHCVNGIILENPVNEILLENKIILSIAIRLKAEKFIIDNVANVPTITSNQTAQLTDLYKDQYPSNYKQINIIEKVNLMTPENIHINSFMYEPLIDMSIYHLIDLYREVESLS